MRITVRAPATIANFGPGFDVFGMCLQEPYDTITVKTFEIEPVKAPEITVSVEGHGADAFYDGLDYRKNTAGRAAAAVKSRFLSEYRGAREKIERIGFEIQIWKGIRPGSGLGSSAASASGAAFAVHCILNKLTGKFLSPVALAECAAEGEGAAGGVHPDNTTPALFGGFTIAFAPKIKYKMVWWEKILNSKLQKAFPAAASIGFKKYAPPKMYFSIIFPNKELKTKEMRSILEDYNPKPDLITANVDNATGVAAGIGAKNLELVCDHLGDMLVAPVRQRFIPRFSQMRDAAKDAGAKAFILCGSGPCVSAVSAGEAKANRILVAMKKACRYKYYMSATTEPNPNGVEVTDADFKVPYKTGAEFLEKL